MVNVLFNGTQEYLVFTVYFKSFILKMRKNHKENVLAWRQCQIHETTARAVEFCEA